MLVFALLAYSAINPTAADQTITLTGHDLTLEQIVQVARNGAKVQLSPEAQQRESDNYGLLLAKAKKYPEAEAELKKAAELDPASAFQPENQKRGADQEDDHSVERIEAIDERQRNAGIPAPAHLEHGCRAQRLDEHLAHGVGIQITRHLRQLETVSVCQGQYDMVLGGRGLQFEIEGPAKTLAQG